MIDPYDARAIRGVRIIKDPNVIGRKVDEEKGEIRCSPEEYDRIISYFKKKRYVMK